MKSILLTSYLLIFSILVNAQYQQPFKVYQENNQFGLIDLNQKMVVKPIYKNIKRSSYGVFAIQGSSLKWALFNKEGQQVTPFLYDNMEQKLPGIVELRKGNLVGLFDDKGKEIIPVQYNKINAIGKVILSKIGDKNNQKPKGFLYRGAIVTKGNLSGFINENGQEVLEIAYQKIQATADFRFNMGIVDVVGLIIKKENKFGIVDEKGAEILPLDYLYINALNQLGFGELQQNGKKGLYDAKFKIIKEPQFDNISILNKGLFAGEKNGVWAIYTKENPETSKLYCDAVKPLSNAYAKITKDNKNGAIDENGNVVVSTEYDVVTPFGQNLFLSKERQNFIFTSEKQIKSWEFDQVITWYNQNENLKPIRNKNGKIGYINDNGELIIEGNYTKGTPFNKDIAIVCKDGKCGFINTEGEFILPMDYELPTLSTQPNFLLAKKGGKYGYLDYQGNTIIQIKYDLLEPFQSVIKAKLNGKYGFINDKEEIIIPHKYDFLESHLEDKKEFRFIDKGKFGWVNLKGIERYSAKLTTWVDKMYPLKNEVRNIKVGNNYGLLDSNYNFITSIVYQKYINFKNTEKAVVRANQKWGMIDKNGKVVIPLIYDDKLKFNNNGFSCIRQNGQFGIIDNNGVIVVPPKYDSYIYSDYEFWTVQKEGKQGIINQEGKVVIPVNYEKVFPYLDGMALVKKDGKWGYIDEQNAAIIPFEYDVLNSFNGGKAMASKSEKWGIIDLSNNIILPFEYENLVLESNGFINAKKDGLWGILNEEYDIIIPHKYDKINLNRKYFKVEKNAKIGVFSIDGNMILPAYYDALTIEDEVGFKVKKDGKFGLMSNSGKVVTPVIYDELSFFVKGFSRVKKDDKYGMILQNGELIIPCKYENLGSRLHGSYVEAKLDGKWGLINQFGKRKTKFKYEMIRFKSNKEIEGLIDEEWEKIKL